MKCSIDNDEYTVDQSLKYIYQLFPLIHPLSFFILMTFCQGVDSSNVIAVVLIGRLILGAPLDVHFLFTYPNYKVNSKFSGK